MVNHLRVKDTVQTLLLDVDARQFLSREQIRPSVTDHCLYLWRRLPTFVIDKVGTSNELICTCTLLQAQQFVDLFAMDRVWYGQYA